MFSPVTECWNCHRQCDRYTRTCPYCGAALPVVYGPEPPPAPVTETKPPPAHAPTASVRRPPPRERADFTLNDPASVRERAAEATGFYAEKAAAEISHVQRLVQAMAKNAQAAAVLIICLCVVAYFGTTTSKSETLGMMDASSMKQAADGQLLQRQAVPSIESLTLGPKTVKVEEAWIAQVGRYDYAGTFSRDIVAVPSGQYRMYFRLTITGGPDTLELTTGTPPRPVLTLNLQRDGAPVVIRAIDLPSFVNPPQSVTVRDIQHPEFGTQTFKIH